ncbi:MAG TPA: tRNA (adenosine(37)-N6)-dimethylallyltransferase MiaA [Burkholderiaceae bacterium]
MIPICLAGPTGTGKTAAALHLAQQLPVEIISVDSALVYRGMDIGTAKPTRDELAAVPHHLIDILDPLAAYSAAEFARSAKQLAGEIAARGRLPVLVGGTMLYFKALFDGLSTLPQADETVRRAIDAEAASIGWPTLHARLAAIDPETAGRLAPNDSQRIQRALEVWQLSGRTLSQWHAEPDRSEGVDWPLFSFEPEDRAWLHQRLDQRFAQMLAGGLIEEVRSLRARGDLHLGLPSMRCVGYRQTWEALDADDMKDLPARGSAATRQLAKRQITWLRSMPRRQVLRCDAPELAERFTAAVMALRPR